MLHWLLSCASDPGPAGAHETADDIATVADIGRASRATTLALLPSRPTIDSVVATGNPLLVHEQIIDVTLSDPAAIAVACTRDADPTEVHLAESAAAESHQLRINGLLAGESYTCAVALTSPRAPARTTPFTITTAPARYRIPEMRIALDESLPMTGGAYTLFNHERYCAGDSTQRLLIVDPEARVRWHHELPAGMDMGIEARPNSDGNIVWGGGNTPEAAAEIVSLSGEVLYKVDFPRAYRTDFHHDGKQIASGEILTLEYSQNHTATANWRGFTLRTFDPASGDQTWEWKSQSGYDQGVLPGGAGDVYHSNWVDIHEEVDGATAYVSLCNRYQVLAVDVATGNVKWLFGPGGDFTLYGPDGNRLPDSFYSSCQHGLEVADGNRILMYDNGWAHGQSRAVEFEIDPAAGDRHDGVELDRRRLVRAGVGGRRLAPRRPRAPRSGAYGVRFPEQPSEHDRGGRQGDRGRPVAPHHAAPLRLVVPRGTDRELHALREREVLCTDPRASRRAGVRLRQVSSVRGITNRRRRSRTPYWCGMRRSTGRCGHRRPHRPLPQLVRRPRLRLRRRIGRRIADGPASP